jgi:hypothetical protein
LNDLSFGIIGRYFLLCATQPANSTNKSVNM